MKICYSIPILKFITIAIFTCCTQSSVLAQENAISLSIPMQIIDYESNRYTSGIAISYDRLFKEHINLGIDLGIQKGIYGKGEIFKINSILIAGIHLQYFLEPSFKKFYFRIESAYNFIDETPTVLKKSLQLSDRLNIGLGLGYSLPYKRIRIKAGISTGLFLDLKNSFKSAQYYVVNLGCGYVF